VKTPPSLRQILVPHALHRLAHRLLGAVQFLADGDPFPGVRRVHDALGVPHHGVMHAHGFAQTQNLAPGFLDRLLVLGLHGNKPLRHHRAEKKRLGGAVGDLLVIVLPQLPSPVRVAQFVENGENLARHRHDHFIHHRPRKLGKVDLGRRRRGRVLSPDDPARQHNAKSNRH